MTTLRLASIENNPVEVGSLDEEFPGSEPIEPRSEFLARIRREELASARVDATIEIDAELRASGLYPIWSGGSASVIVAGRRCRLVPDSAARPYDEWVSGIEARELPIRESFRRLNRDARLAAEGEA